MALERISVALARKSPKRKRPQRNGVQSGGNPAPLDRNEIASTECRRVQAYTLYTDTLNGAQCIRRLAGSITVLCAGVCQCVVTLSVCVCYHCVCHMLHTDTDSDTDTD